VLDVSGAGTVSGNIKIKIRKHDFNANTDTDVVGTERIINFVTQTTFVTAGATLLVPAQKFLITFLDTVTSGNFEYRLWAASSISLTNFNIRGYALKFDIQGMRIQP